ncbi:hypothetical protein ACJJIF_21405 [Microbulbifer sp. SSSA002]|uniref:hypothetical protein n=1 Tax=unclassified Microbulbifer TaxID=2619833 RepID=UPI00403940BF
MKRISLMLLLVLIPALSWSFVKPIRLLFPQLNGVVCDDSICVENSKNMILATEIFTKSIEQLLANDIYLEVRPNFVYCSTIKCYESFGGGNERAISYPFLGTIIGPNSWQSYITQHELIHWFQFSELGVVSTMTRPEWFREGMAYEYSGAPKSDIPKHYLPVKEAYKNWHSDKPWSEVIHHARGL